METEGNSNGSKLVNTHECMNAVGALSSALAAMLMEGNETKEGGDGILAKKQHVAMGMDVLDCPMCSTPLSHPIFQCSMGHFVCSACRDKLPRKACHVCSRAVMNHCYGMERVVGSIVVPCSYAVHGCTDMIAYHKKGQHETACRHAPCFCPDKGCGFTAGTTEALLDHFASAHKWPTTRFHYYVPFDVPVKAGVHVLHGGEDGHLFLIHIAPLDSTPLHGVSLVRVELHAQESKFGCSVGFSWFEGHYQASTLDAIRSTSLSDGLPTDYFLTVPKVCRGGDTRVVLSVTIDTEMVYRDDGKLEEEDDDDKNYTEKEDDDSDEDVDDDEEDDGDEEEDDEDEESWEEVSDYDALV